jgi:hypothetical protein
MVTMSIRSLKYQLAPLVGGALRSSCCLSFHRKFASSASGRTSRPEQSSSTLAPLGVAAALKASRDPSVDPRPQIYDEFSLSDRVAIVSGGNRGLGLEMALAFCEAGARAVYCVDIPLQPSEEWECTRDFAARMGSRLEYISADVRDQAAIWTRIAEVGNKEKRMDVCVTAAGILKAHTECLDYPADEFREVSISGNTIIHLMHCGIEGDGCQHKWFTIHSPSCWEANGQVWESREHHSHRLNERKYHKQGEQDMSLRHADDLRGYRTMRGCPITPANLPSSRWREAWLVNLVLRVSA